MNELPADTGEWVLLSYRLPRAPSTPRTAVWRKLRRLGVAQVGDGLAALPASARTREQLEWIAEEVTDAGGAAAIWLARPATRRQEAQLVATMTDARVAEYEALISAAVEASENLPAIGQSLRKLRNELRAIERRDYFPPPERDYAQVAIQALTDYQANRPQERAT